jgi:hypothetical protein
MRALRKAEELILGLEQRLSEADRNFGNLHDAHMSVIDTLISQQRRATIAEQQRDWVIGFAQRLLEEIVGIQLTNHLIDLPAANAKVQGEMQTANRILNEIAAKHAPAPIEQEQAA